MNKLQAAIENYLNTEMRISELCSLKPNDINLYNRNILIYGKGAKERKIQLCNDDAVIILEKHQHPLLYLVP